MEKMGLEGEGGKVTLSYTLLINPLDDHVHVLVYIVESRFAMKFCMLW